MTPPPANGANPGSPRAVGDFRLRRRLGAGPHGATWEADDLRLGRTVALKILDEELVKDPKCVEAFSRQAKAAARMQHPALLPVYGSGEDQGKVWVSTELIPGSMSLSTWLQENPPSKKRDKLTTEWIGKTFASIADGLEQAHQAGIVHRNICPKNILLTAERFPKVTSFDLALVRDMENWEQPSGQTVIGMTHLEGTDHPDAKPKGKVKLRPYHMSPEQASADRASLDFRTDIFSLGATLFEVLTGVRPFQGSNTSAILQKVMTESLEAHPSFQAVPKKLRSVVIRATQKSPENRYSSMAEFANDLQNFAQNTSAKPNKWALASTGSAAIAALWFGLFSPSIEGEKIRGNDTALKAPSAVTARPDLYLVTLCVEDYDEDSMDLKFASKDGDDIETFFKSQKGRLYEKVHVRSLRNEEVSTQSINTLRHEFLTLAKRNDSIIVFVAGHGVNQHEEYFFLTPSATEEQYAQGVTYTDLEKMVTWDKLYSERSLLLLDTCQSGRPTAGNRGGISISPFTSTFRLGNGTFVISAAGSTGAAQEADGNGLFTAAMLKGLRGEAAENGEVRIIKLLDFIRDEVQATSGGNQKVQLRQGGGDDFLLARPSTK